jgi:hypothetical protein
VGAGRPREGIELLEKGVRNLPRSWRLRQDLGFFLHLFLGETDRAAAVLNEAAAVPGSAFWLRMMAADLLAKGGSRTDSRRMWQQMYEQAEEGIIKQNARLRLDILDSLDAVDRLTGRVAEFERRHGRRPARLAELREAGLWSGPLVDVAGTPFGYDGKSGRVFISRESLMWRPD